MNIKIGTSLCLTLLLSACTAIRVENVTQVSKSEILDEIVVVNDPATRSTVLPVIQNHLINKGYNVTVVQSEGEIKPSDYALEYRAFWSWDFALYMSKANMKILHNGVVIGNVDYEGKGGLNTNKWGDAEHRLKIMLDTLLNEMSIEEANKRIQ